MAPKASVSTNPTAQKARLAQVRLPSRRTKVIRRQRLIDLLDESVSHRATIVSAPAGFGKTTLLVDHAQTADRPICWYSLEQRDRELNTFLVNLVASLREQFLNFDPKLKSLPKRPSPKAIDEVAAALVEGLSALEQPCVIVLDDFHCLDEGATEVTRFIESWLSGLPENCHLVISSRTRPEISVLPLLTARQEIAVLGAADLALDCQETKQLLAEAMDKDVPLDDAQYLADATDGWASAIVLLAEKVGHPGLRSALSRLLPSDTLYQYIEAELLSALPEPLQEFVLGYGILRVAEPGVCNELLGVTDAEEKLASLERHHLFVSRPEGPPGHHFLDLFRVFLASKLRAEQPERFHSLHLKAGAISEGNDRWQDAMYHYLEARCWDKVVAVTDRVGHKLFEEGQWDELAECLEAIPQEEVAAQPKLILWKAKILHYLNQLDDALQLLAGPLLSLEAEGDWTSLADGLITKGMCLRRKGDYHEAKEALSRARALLLEHDGPLSLLTEARKELGITYGMCGEFDLALPELKGVLDIYDAQGDVYNIAHVNDQLGACLGSLGRLAEAATHFERAKARWEKLRNQIYLVHTLNNLGYLYYLQGEHPQAQEIFQEALRQCSNSDAASTASVGAYVLWSLGDIDRDGGDFQSALQSYKQSLERARQLDDIHLVIHNLDAMANTHRLIGDLNAAEALVNQATAEAEECDSLFDLGLCQITCGLILRHRSQLAEAATALERAVELLKKGDAKRELARAYFHLAEAYYSQRRRRAALECLEIIAKLVEQLGYHHFLVVEAQRAPLLVQYGAANKIADGFYTRLLKQTKVTHPPSEGDQAEEEAPTVGRLPKIEAFGFGNLRVCLDGREVSDLEWRSEKSKEMFFFFLSNPRPLRKEEIVTAIWPDLPEDKTNSAFHSNLYRLRKALYAECVVKDGGRYLLNPQGNFWCDVNEFQRALRDAEAASSDSQERLSLLERAASLYKGAFAQDFYAEWVDPLRWQMEEQHLRLLASLAGAYFDHGDHKRSAEICQQILAFDEFNEAAWYRLLQSYLASGEVEAAKFAYRRYMDLLRDNLQGEPSEQFRQLMRELAATKGPTATK